MMTANIVRATTVLVSAYCFGTVANAQTTPYVAATGALTFPKSLETDTGISGELNNGYAFTLAVGTGIGPIRAEIEGSYRRSSVEGASGFGLDLPGTGNASALSAMANAYFDPAFNIGPLQPYVGGGVGISRFRASNVAALGLPFGGPVTSFGPISGDRTGFAWQLMAGVGVALTEKAAFTLGYRYFATPGVTVNDVPQFNSVRINGLKIHAVEAGVRLSF
ncbi:outer membrane protein [Polymorphobacter fuscus]|nr:outer membrane beta-barrel protein [Polymorphobacter fuscus]NJC07325.1 opacity protein-like surface antigen [Polymorphobacter fuscus]